MNTENANKTTRKLSLYMVNKPKKEAPIFLYGLFLFILSLCLLATWMILCQERPLVIYHTVKKGDTLRSLASLYYQNPQEWSKIFLANRKQLRKRRELRPGEILVVPLYNSQEKNKKKI